MQPIEYLIEYLQGRDLVIGSDFPRFMEVLDTLDRPWTLDFLPADFVASSQQLNSQSFRGKKVDRFDMWSPSGGATKKFESTSSLHPAVQAFVRELKNAMWKRIHSSQMASPAFQIAVALDPIHKDWVLKAEAAIDEDYGLLDQVLDEDVLPLKGLFTRRQQLATQERLRCFLEKATRTQTPVPSESTRAASGGTDSSQDAFPDGQGRAQSDARRTASATSKQPLAKPWRRPVAVIRNELDRWMDADLEHKQGQTSVAFWTEERKKDVSEFPFLLEFARTAFGAPRTSAEAERDFSALANLYTPKRRTMLKATVARRLYLKLNEHWWQANPTPDAQRRMTRIRNGQIGAHFAPTGSLFDNNDDYVDSSDDDDVVTINDGDDVNGGDVFIW
jgi:hypothetical protein